MTGAVFHFVAFAVLAAGLMLSAALFVALAVVLTGGGGKTRPRAGRVPARVLARTPRFDLAIDG